MKKVIVLLVVFFVATICSAQEEDSLHYREAIMDQMEKRRDSVFVVDYSKSVEEMLEASQYDWVYRPISGENFPALGGGEIRVSARLFYFEGKKSREIISEIEKAGYRPANIFELLALGKEYPELQKSFRIVALGTVWENERGFSRVPILFFRGEEIRSLSLSWFTYDWSQEHRFLGIKKTKNKTSSK
jgi:hypothetical protein